MPAPPSNSQFPSHLWIGQPPQTAPDVEELYIDRPKKSTLPKRLRDRDEELGDMVMLGLGAPRALDVANGFRIRGVKTHHHQQSLHRTGLSAANASATTLSDLAWWTAGGNLIFAGFDGLETTRTALVRANVPLYGYSQASPVALVWLSVSTVYPTLPLVQVNLVFANTAKSRRQAGGSYSGCVAELSWSGTVGPGSCRFLLSLQSQNIPYFGAGFIQIASAPTLSAILV